MAGLVPEGFVTLRDAFDRFRLAIWNGREPVADLDVLTRTGALPFERQSVHRASVSELVDLERDLFCGFFKSGAVQAFAITDSFGAKVVVPPREWQTAFAPDMLFLKDEVPPGYSDYFDKLAEQTLLVAEELLSAFLTNLSVIEPARRQLSNCATNILLGLAGDGALIPEMAESIAEEWGMRPIASKPMDSELDPMVETAWTLPMSLAWIIWREPRKVRENWGRYAQQCYDWHTERRRMPVEGGKSWYEADSSEIRQRLTPSVALLGIATLIEQDAKSSDRPSVSAARDELWRRLGEGDLAMTAIDRADNVVQIPKTAWSYLKLAQGHDDQDYLRMDSPQPQYRGLKLQRSDLLRLWPPPRSQALSFATGTLHTFPSRDSSWNLFEACLWVGCEGQEMLTDDIEAAALDDNGASLLFKALADGTLTATGIGSQRLRESIPAAYWELATLDPDHEGHLVSFIDDAAQGIWGTLTPFGEAGPRWDRISIGQTALKRAFRFTMGKRLDCLKWLEQLMHDSPEERPKSKSALRVEAMERFGITRADFDRTWLSALEKVPEAKAFWTRSGRPKNYHK